MKFLKSNEIEIDKINTYLARILRTEKDKSNQEYVDNKFAYSNLTGLKYDKRMGATFGLASINEEGEILTKPSADENIIIDRFYNPKKVTLMDLLGTKTLMFATNPYSSIIVDYPDKYEEHFRYVNQFMPNGFPFRDLTDAETKEVKQRLKRRLKVLGTINFFKYSKSKGGWPNFVVYGSNPHTFSDDKHTYNGIKYGLQPVRCGPDDDSYLSVINYGSDVRLGVVLDLVKALSQQKCLLVSTDKKVEIDLDDLEVSTQNPYKDLVDDLCKENNIDPLVPLF